MTYINDNKYPPSVCEEYHYIWILQISNRFWSTVRTVFRVP